VGSLFFPRLEWPSLCTSGSTVPQLTAASVLVLYGVCATHDVTFTIHNIASYLVMPVIRVMMLGSSLSTVLANRRRNGKKREIRIPSSETDPFALVLRGHPGGCGRYKPQHDIMRRYTGMLAPATWSNLKG
jgi:hypothetical protein